MAIDAVIIAVDGDRLDLVPRLNNPAGQLTLTVTNPDEHLAKLEGKQVWGGDSALMIGDKRIADRIGYTSVKMIAGWMSALEGKKP